jgi:hypothetical protein
MFDSPLNDSGKLSAMAAPLSNVEHAPAPSSPFQAMVTWITRLKHAIAGMELWLAAELEEISRKLMMTVCQPIPTHES